MDFHQCMFGALSTKPTRFLYWNGRFDTLACRCDHPRTVRNGRRWASHPPLAGRDEHGNFKTRAASAYPTRLNMWIASIINLELARPVSDERRREPLEVTSEPPVGIESHTSDTKITDDIMSKQSAFFGTTALSRAYDLAGPKPATGPAIRASENWQCLGGMRRPDRSVLTNEGYKRPGKRLQDMAEQFVNDHPESMAVAESLRIGDSVTGFDESIKAEFRRRWMHTLGAASSDRPIGPDPETLEAWGRAVGDYDAARILHRRVSRTNGPVFVQPAAAAASFAFPPLYTAGLLFVGHSQYDTKAREMHGLDTNKIHCRKTYPAQRSQAPRRRAVPDARLVSRHLSLLSQSPPQPPVTTGDTNQTMHDLYIKTSSMRAASIISDSQQSAPVRGSAATPALPEGVARACAHGRRSA